MEIVEGIFILGLFVSFLVGKAIFVAHDFAKEELEKKYGEDAPSEKGIE